MFSPPQLPPWDGLHPLVVHFPIALLFVAPLLLLLALFWKKQSRGLMVGATLLTILAAIGAMLATSTGEAAEELAERVPGAGAILDEHAELGESARNVLVAMALAMSIGAAVLLAAGERLPRALGVVAGLVGIVAFGAASLVISNAAHEGGRLVHEVGVRAWATASASTPAPSATAPPLAPRATSPPSAVVDRVRLDGPAPDAAKPADLPGLHNVVTYVDGLYSGAVPEGDDGFETLARLGVRTIISVDGAEPEVEKAKAHGIRYVHLPIGYNGFDESRKLELARAVRDLPGPVYVHCHHGKHRSAGAVGAVAVTLGLLDPEKATERMKVSGTAPSYKGLWTCVAESSAKDAANVDRASAVFPEISPTEGLVKSMVTIDEVTEHLKSIQKAGWKAPPDHPDLVPAAEAGRLADLLRNLQHAERVKAKPAEFTQWMLRNSDEAAALEAGLLLPQTTTDEHSKRFAVVLASCKECHVKYRD
jgi:uncharacterized membrane protein/protein tyrosine phosphatase (PTP) superfamily phosphohydrolase (DUF442 family)